MDETKTEQKKRVMPRMYKLVIASVMMLAVGIFGVQFKTIQSAMLTAAVNIAIGLVFIVEAFREYKEEKKV